MTFKIKQYLSWFEPSGKGYEWTRFALLRGLGFIYVFAFLSLSRQVIALIGHDGLLPADLFLNRLDGQVGFFSLPSIFRFTCSDFFLQSGAWLGLILSILVMLGATNAILMFVLWFLYMSYVHVGQLFYGYGWETMTLEAGFLAVFLCPLKSIRPFPVDFHPPPVVLFWYRWMLFRVMFGAGLIKIRGDECWRDLTCLVYHYETQPIPNPISWYLHHMPLWFHESGVVFNHFAELIIPFFYFAPRRLRHAAGIITIIFQSILIISGNLSWLNWLTIVIAIPCFGDIVKRGDAAPQVHGMIPSNKIPVRATLLILSAALAWLSIYPIINMLSPRQIMNTSFDSFHIMNTYGAFGSVGKVRHEIILEGSRDGDTWLPYEFKAKPGDPKQRPVFIAPYQSRIDWQIWFAAMEDPDSNPWLLHMIYKLLQGDKRTIALLGGNPFAGDPPKYIRASYYTYRFSNNRGDGVWWDRTYLGQWLPPLSLDNPGLLRFLRAYGWLPE